jgi:hypothetical protein
MSGPFMIGRRSYQARSAVMLCKKLVARTGLETVISAVRGQRVNQLHQCAA